MKNYRARIFKGFTAKESLEALDYYQSKTKALPVVIEFTLRETQAYNLPVRFAVYLPRHKKGK